MIKEITPQILSVIMFLILLVAPTLTLPTSWLLLRRYRAAVIRAMSARVANAGGPSEPAAPTAPAGPDPVVPGAGAATETRPADLLYRRLVRDPWRHAVTYAAAGVAFAGSMTLAFFVVFSFPFQPALLVFSVWMCSWPVVLTTNVVVAGSWRTRVTSTLVYFAGLTALAAMTPAQSLPGLSGYELPAQSTITPSGAARIWLGFNLPPTALLLLFLNRRVRAVGPVLLSFMTVAAGGTILVWLGMFYKRAPDAYLWLGMRLHAGRWGMASLLIGSLVLALLIFSALGWIMLIRLRRAYQDKIINDQSLVLDAIWLVFTTFYSIFLVLGGLGWVLAGALAFVVYRLAVRIGHKLVAMPEPRPHGQLLFLRVFSLGSRSERMFDAVARHWRYLDTVQLIVGPDLATATVAPHEFMEYVAGKLPRLFIGGRPALEQRIRELDSKPDADGRFRVNIFFCREDTWPDVLSRLVRETHAVLMDLRAFAPSNAGCVRELRELINVIPLRQCVFVVDGTTDQAFLERTLEDIWRDMQAGSPNQATSRAELRPFWLRSLGEDERRRLLRCLCEAVEPASRVA